MTTSANPYTPFYVPRDSAVPQSCSSSLGPHVGHSWHHSTDVLRPVSSDCGRVKGRWSQSFVCWTALLLLTPFSSASLASTLALTLASTGMLEAWADPAIPMPMMQVKRASLKKAALEYILADWRGQDHELLASLPECYRTHFGGLRYGECDSK